MKWLQTLVNANGPMIFQMQLVNVNKFKTRVIRRAKQNLAPLEKLLIVSTAQPITTKFLMFPKVQQNTIALTNAQSGILPDYQIKHVKKEVLIY